MHSNQNLLDRYTVYSRPEFNIQLERNKQNTIFMHCNITKWGKSIYKELIYAEDSITTMLALAGCKIIFVAVNKEDLKLKKFIRLFGFISSKKFSDKGYELFFKRPSVGE